MLVEKIYFVENSTELERCLELLAMPIFCMRCDREFIEMNYSKLTILCLESQVCGIEHILEKVI